MEILKQLLKQIPKQIINDILTIIYPDHCIGCDKILKSGESKWVCDDCSYHFEIRDYRKCEICGRIIYHRGKCRICNSEKVYFDKGYSVFEYKEAVRNAIREFKYRGMFRYGKYLGEIMADNAADNINTEFDYVTAVPLHPKRYRGRGYNQSEILAKAVAKALGVEYRKLLVRCVNTKPQNSLDRKERLKNIKGAFSIKDNVSVENKNILIIDDIFTTGSTVNECSRILKNNRALRVEFFALSCRSED